MSGDVGDRRGRVPAHEQFAGNVHQAQRGDDAKEQVPKSGHSPWIVGRAHVPSLVERAYCKGLAGDTPKAIKKFRHASKRGWCDHSATSRDAARQSCQPPSMRPS